VNELKLTLNDFAILLNERELSKEVISTFSNEEPLLYRNLSAIEVNEVLKSIKNKILSPETNSAGPEFRGNWEANWRENLDKFRPKKKKLAVPQEFLEGANNYDEKLVVVKLFAEKNVQNTVRLFKNMLKDDIERKKKV
jgi:hypothetical protein